MKRVDISVSDGVDQTKYQLSNGLTSYGFHQNTTPSYGILFQLMELVVKMVKNTSCLFRGSHPKTERATKRETITDETD